MKRQMTMTIVLMTLATALPSLADEQRNWDPYKLPEKAEAYATDQAAYNLAQREAQAAQREVNRARQASLASAQASPEYRRAVNDSASANEAYMALRRQVKADLAANDTRYKELLGELSDVERRIETARYARTSFNDFSALYREKQEITNQMRRIEDAALESAGANDLRRQWTAATQTAQALKTQHKHAAETAPAVVAAREKAAIAQKKLDSAGVQLAGSRAAYAEADHQQAKVDDYYRKHPETGDSYYGYGYGGYYWGYRPTVTVYRR